MRTFSGTIKKTDFIKEIRPRNGTLLNYLKEQLQTPSDNCLVWPYTVVAGYGQIRYNGKKWRVHNLALRMAKGEPPKDKLLALHLPTVCHNPLCFNPRHLYWGTAKQNSRDRTIDNTQARGSGQGSSKLSSEQVLEIRDDNRKLGVIAEQYGVTKANICTIKSRKSWGWL